LDLEVPLATSTAYIPNEDAFELSRTAAGFGAVRISPVHAATLAAALANGGIMPKPFIIERITTSDGVTLEKRAPQMLHQVVRADTAKTLLDMMEYTTTIGTSRRAFMTYPGRSVLGSINVAGKTGTLSGNNPHGLHNWFIGAAPKEDPQIAVAVITVDAGYTSKASLLARRTIQRAFNIPGWDNEAARPVAHKRRSGLSASRSIRRSSGGASTKGKSYGRSTQSSKGKTKGNKGAGKGRKG
jgi:cell division protein FtsI/penicillin-binding protein 2